MAKGRFADDASCCVRACACLLYAGQLSGNWRERHRRRSSGERSRDREGSSESSSRRSSMQSLFSVRHAAARSSRAASLAALAGGEDGDGDARGDGHEVRVLLPLPMPVRACVVNACVLRAAYHGRRGIAKGPSRLSRLWCAGGPLLRSAPRGAGGVRGGVRRTGETMKMSCQPPAMAPPQHPHQGMLCFCRVCFSNSRVAGACGFAEIHRRGARECSCAVCHRHQPSAFS